MRIATTKNFEKNLSKSSVCFLTVGSIMETSNYSIRFTVAFVHNKKLRKNSVSLEIDIQSIL